MNETEVKAPAEFILPSTVVTRADVSRLVSELERVDDELIEANIRAGGENHAQAPALSDQLAEFLAQNKLTLDSSNERTELVRRLHALKDKVPVISMTFAVEADHQSLQQLVQWLRTSIHPQAVIAVGLQPALVAGVYLRTPNHVHDLSLRAALDGQHDSLVKDLEALRGAR